jgi:hypothetical protein
MSNLSNLIQKAVECPNIVDGNFDKTLGEMQKILGVETGDVAGVYFAGKERAWVSMTREERLASLYKYLSYELASIVDMDHIPQLGT